MSELFKNAIVQKRNVLNELRSNNMTVQELRFFSIYLSKINPRDKSTRVVRFPLDDFRKIMDFGRLNLAQLKASTDRLLCKIVHLPKPSGGYTSFQLFKNCTFDKDDNGNWYVEINSSDDALPLLFDFKDRYFKYALWNALQLKSANQIRMYEILKQYEKIGRRELTVTELRELLGISPNEYDRFERFRVRVLDSCQEALKQTTDICYTYERGKTGRGGKWLTIVFHIKKNKDYVDQLTLSEYMKQSDTEPIEATVIETENNIPGAASAPPDKDGEFVGQTEPSDKDKLEKKRLKRYDNDTELAELAKSVDDIFTARQMRLVIEIVESKGVPKEKIAKVLRSHYLMMQVFDEQSEGIKNKYKYYLKMLENYKPQRKEECDDGDSSFNIDKWYEIAESYDPESIGFKDDD